MKYLKLNLLDIDELFPETSFLWHKDEPDIFYVEYGHCVIGFQVKDDKAYDSLDKDRVIGELVTIEKQLEEK